MARKPSRPDGDKVLADLDRVVDTLEEWSDGTDERIVRKARRLMATVRTVAHMLRGVRPSVGLTIPDRELIERLAAAASACDSALLELASLRLHSLVPENQSLRQQVESLSERPSRLD
jgi:hypothetical protein